MSRRPARYGDSSACGDASCTVADHTARHGHEPGLVEARYGLDRERVCVVPDQDVVVANPISGVVGVEAPLQVAKRLAHDRCALVLPGKAGSGHEERIPEREVRRPARVQD